MAVTARFVADFSSFNDAIEKAEVVLKSFEQDANKVEKSLTRMGNSLSGQKLIQDATLMAAAVERVGGVSQLTERQLQQVGAQAKEAAEKMRLLGIGVPENLQKIADAAEKAGKSTAGLSGWFGSLGKEVAATAAGFISAQAVIGAAQSGFRALTAFLGDSVKSYAAAEAAQSKLTTAMRQQGTAIPQNISAFNELAKEFQRTTVYGDDLIASMQSLLVQVGNVMPAQMKEALQASADLASGLGIDLEQATQLVAKAAAGHTETLGRYGVTVDDAALKSRGFEAVLEQINKQFGGQAAAQIETYAGKVEQLANAWDDFKEAVGGAVANDDIVRDGLVRTTKAAAAAGESNIGLASALKGVYGAIPGVGLLFTRLVDHYEKVAEKANLAREAAERFNKGLPKPQQVAPLVVPTADSKIVQDFLKDTDEKLKKLSASAREAIAEAKRVADALAKMRASIVNTERQPFTHFTDGLDKVGQATADIELLRRKLEADAQAAAKAAEEHRKLGAALAQIQREGLPYFLDGLDKLGQKIDVVAPKARGLADALKSLFAGDFKSLFKDLENFFRNGLSDIGRGVLEGFGNLISGGLTSLINKGLALLGKGIAKLFGGLFGDREHMQVNDLRDAFQSTFGTFEDMAAAAERVGYNLKDLLDTKRVEDFNREMEKFKDAIDFQDEAMQTLDETVQKYGFTLEELGPTLQRQRLDKQAQELYQDFQVLTGAGIETGAVIRRMADQINDFIHAALKTGTEVPAAMKPMLQRMADMGLLTDDAGNVITDLKDSGITFAETMTQGFDRVVKSVDRLVQAIARGLGIALDGLDSQLRGLPDEINVDVNVRPRRDPSEWQDLPVPPDAEIVPMASGGMGRVTKPTLFLAGEAGPESFAFSGANRTFGETAQSQTITVSGITVNVYADKDDDPVALGKKINEALRINAGGVYDGVAVIADRRIAAAA